MIVEADDAGDSLMMPGMTCRQASMSIGADGQLSALFISLA